MAETLTLLQLRVLADIGAGRDPYDHETRSARHVTRAIRELHRRGRIEPYDGTHPGAPEWREVTATAPNGGDRG